VHDLLGDAAWLADDRESARDHYLAVAESGAPAHLRRGAQAKLAVLGEDAYRRILAERGSVTEDVATLANLTLFGPERTLARYLLGRRLVAEGTWDGAEEQLREATTGALPSEEIKAEALRLLGIARHRLDNDAGAETAFTDMATLERTRAEVIRARAWIDRTRWRRGLDFAEWPEVRPGMEERIDDGSGENVDESVAEDADGTDAGHVEPATPTRADVGTATPTAETPVVAEADDAPGDTDQTATP
jgi:hypothetical protein